MSGPIHLFVSSSPELYAERQIVGEVVAALPLTIGWRIGHTPIAGEATDGEFRVEESDLYILILGQDFAAPMGYEVRQGAAMGRKPLAFRKQSNRSPSAQDATRRLDLEWRDFGEAAELRLRLTRDLVQAILQRATQFGLELNEIERLSELARETEGKETEAQTGRRRSDAGRSGVILGREVWETEQ